MAELKGTFYGVSVGPGNPELMTLQAVRLIRQCPVLAAPQTASGQMLALDIARSALGEALDGKTIVPLYFAMSRDPAALAASHEKAAAAVRQYLDAGQDVAMLNIGDVSIYATFGYLQEILQAGGYATAMAAGVPSFCAAAASHPHVSSPFSIVIHTMRQSPKSSHKSFFSLSPNFIISRPIKCRIFIENSSLGVFSQYSSASRSLLSQSILNLHRACIE